MASDIYCSACGYPNDTSRGACLMCYSLVKAPPGGAPCPSCGTDGPKGAIFCISCQAALGDGELPLQRPDVSGLVSAGAVGGVVADAGEYADDLEFGVPETTGDESELDFDVAPPPPADSVDLDMGEVAGDTGQFDLPSADTGEFMVPPEGDTGEVMPPPPDTAFELADDDGAPPAPPDSVSLDLEDVQPAAGGDDDMGEWTLDYDE